MNNINELRRRTPLMGWASWNCFRTNISEDILKKQADLLVSTGLAFHGYTYFNVDDGFLEVGMKMADFSFMQKDFQMA